MKIIIVTLLALLLSSAIASATDRYASPSGSGTTCSSVSPCTLNTAIGQALAGENVILKNGTYNQRLNTARSGTALSPITIKAETRRLATIAPNPTDTRAISVAHDYIHVNGIIFDGRDNGCCLDSEIYVAATAPDQILGFVFEDNEVKRTVGHSSIFTMNVTGAIFRWNAISQDNADAGFTGHSGEAFYMGSATGGGGIYNSEIYANTIIDPIQECWEPKSNDSSGNEVHHNICDGSGRLTADGISPLGSANYGPITFSSSGPNNFHDNIIKNFKVRPGGGGAMEYGASGSGNIIQNNVFRNQLTGGAKLASTAAGAATATSNTFCAFLSNSIHVGWILSSNNGAPGADAAASACDSEETRIIAEMAILPGNPTPGAVTWVNDRGGAGNATGSTTWTAANIPLKAGINNITVTGTNASLNSGFDQIAVTYAPAFPGNALVGAWGFEDGSGTSATDSSGNGNTATLFRSAVWVTTGRFGKAIQLNGIDQYLGVSDANNLDFSQSFTLSAWVQPSASHTDFRAVVSKQTGMSPGHPYELYATVEGYCGSGGMSGFVNTNGMLGTSGPPYSACSSTPLAVNVWSHVAVTYDNATALLKLYKNGTLLTTTSATGYMEASTGDLNIGATEFGEYFQGLIDEVRAYNYAIPITAGANTSFGATCNAAAEISTPSITGDANCPVIPLLPPIDLKIGAAQTLKLGATGGSFKAGQVP